MTNDRIAAIDVGSNTVKVKISEFTKGNFKQIVYKHFPSNLSLALNRKKIIDIQRTGKLIAALKDIKQILKDNKAEHYKAIATEALRIAKNRVEVLHTIKLQTRIDVEIISEDYECELTLAAVLLDVPAEKNFVCINSGGASTEVIVHLENNDFFFNFNFGAVNLYERYFQNNQDTGHAINEMEKDISVQLKSIDTKLISPVEQVISLGGSIYNAAFIYKKDKERKFDDLDKMRLRVSNLEAVLKRLKEIPEDERKNIAGMDERRTQTALPGILVHYFILKYFNKTELIISTRSISDGLLIELSGEIRS